MDYSLNHGPLLDDLDLEEGNEGFAEKTTKPPSPWFRAFAVLLRALRFALPTWLQIPNKKEAGARTAKPRLTAYLDGIRGLVSFLVFVRHFSLPWQSHLDYGYGQQGLYHDLLRLPFFRLLFGGPLVPVFFVVSGYVLSAKTLKLSRQKAWDNLFLSLASSTFRRAIRLFLPPLISTFTVMLLAYFGYFSFDYRSMPGRLPDHPIAFEGFGDQLVEWFDFASMELTNPWTWSRRRMLYGPHLWTIPVSLQGSLVVFLLCLGLARARPIFRFGFLMFTAITTELLGRWDMAPFIGGMLLCEIDISFNTQTEGNSRITTRKWITTTLNTIILVIGLYVGSFPRFNDHGNACVSGYRFFCDITADYHYWHGVSALVIILALSRERILRLPLESALFQYLGSISFSLYITHEPFIHVVAFRLVPMFWDLTGNDTTVCYQAGLILSLFTSAFLLVWIADVFKAVVEDPSARLAGNIESWCFGESK